MDKETINIAEATESDLPEILRLQHLAYQSEAILAKNPDIPPLKQTLLELRAEFQRGSLLKAIDPTGKILGSVRYFYLGDTVSIGKLMVHPACQGHGLGTRLLRMVEENCPGKRLELFTGRNSTRNIALYERCGFCKFKEQIVNENLTLVYMEKLVKMQIISLKSTPECLERFIQFFASHWNNEAVYRDCMTACLKTASVLPQWYLLMDGETIVGGCGLIVNDFNARQDLWPWLCALYIEEAYRGHAYGAMLLEHAKCEALTLGFQTLYLATDHIGYYEKYGFEFIGMTSDPFGGTSRIYRNTAFPGEIHED